jgi:L-ascorbate metabolism protein UlaG (beta-lactamase superfamily)
MDKSLLVFDHYMNENKGLEYGSVSEADLINAERVYVFVSHSHSDHYSKDIFKWADVNPNTTYILDSTVKPDKNVNSVVLSKGKTYDDGYIFVEEFGSTDMGGSFYVTCEGKRFYHAGDFNYWHWRDEGDERYSRVMRIYFDKELKFLQSGVKHIDYAFFPVDNRIGSGYDEGADMFIETMKPAAFVPIHFRRFRVAEEYGKKSFPDTNILIPAKNGDRLI